MYCQYRILKDRKKCYCCLHYKECYKEDFANTIINKFPNYTEIIQYKKDFSVVGNFNIADIDRTRKWYYDDNNILCPKDNASIPQLMKTIKSSRKRSLDCLFGYALANEWQYFVTLTFNNDTGQKYNNKYVKMCWRNFRTKLQRKFPSIKILLVPEYHKKGGLHFHGFFGNVNIDNYIQSAINNNQYLYDFDSSTGEKIFKKDNAGNLVINKYYGRDLVTQNGDKIYNFIDGFFNYGYTTIVKIKKGSSSLKLTNYLTKYIGKDTESNVAYNAKSYYHTNNLLFKEKIVANVTDYDIDCFLSGFGLHYSVEIKKDNSRMRVIMIKNIESEQITNDT